MIFEIEKGQLSETQSYILSVLTTVLEAIEMMGITYYMQGGTMLGAVRHQGFIPWDDDIDLGLPRSDYECFLKNIEKYLPQNLELRTFEDSSDHHYYFSRIIDTRYYIKRMGGMEVRLENVWVDIFPLDGMPNNKVCRELHKGRLLFVRLLYHLSCFEKVNIKRPGRPLIEMIIIKIALKINIQRFLNTKKLLFIMDHMLKKYPYEKSEWIINFMGQTSYHFNEMFLKKVYDSYKLYKFETICMVGPEDYDTYLTSLYGDYMTPPKVEDRNVHVSKLVKI